MFYVYIKKSDSERFNIGSTQNLKHRINQHNDKSLKSWTNRFYNWELIYKEEYSTRKDALIREREIKSFKGGNDFKKLIKGS